MTQKGKETTRKNDKKSIVNIPETGYNERQEESLTEAPIKDFKELDLTDNFMFSAVMKDPELCRPLLEMILDVKIERIVYTEKEKTVATKAATKSVRLDVYVQDCRGTVYDIEMQTTKIFLNPHYKVECVSPELSNFLKFLTTGNPVDEYTERLVAAVEAARNNEYLNIEYMSMWAMKTDARNEGRGEGLNEGLLALVRTVKPILVDFDKVFDRVISNKEYADVSREKVMEYYQKCL